MMILTSYNDYARELRATIGELRECATTAARIQIAICRNGYGYKIVESLGCEPCKQLWCGPLAADSWTEDGSRLTDAEIERFFDLPQIFAYSDHALKRPRNPVMTAHWDATVALIEVSIESGDRVWEQRMMFVGFADAVHAEFSIAVDRDILVHDHATGSQFYEWRTVNGCERRSEPSAYKQPEQDLQPQEIEKVTRIFLTNLDANR